MVAHCLPFCNPQHRLIRSLQQTQQHKIMKLEKIIFCASQHQRPPLLLGAKRKLSSYLHRSISPHLVLFFLASGLGAQDPFRLAVHISLVLKSNTAEMAEDVLHLGIGVAAGGAAKVVDPFHA